MMTSLAWRRIVPSSPWTMGFVVGCVVAAPQRRSRLVMSTARLRIGLRLRMGPRTAIRPTEQFVGFIVIGNLALLRIPVQRAAQLHGKVGEDATGCADVA